MNVSMSELIVILLIALLVIKPDDMPKIAFTLGKIFQKGRKLISTVKEDLAGLYDESDKKPSQ